jgi:hypothetical protein
VVGVPARVLAWINQPTDMPVGLTRLIGLGGTDHPVVGYVPPLTATGVPEPVLAGVAPEAGAVPPPPIATTVPPTPPGVEGESMRVVGTNGAGVILHTGPQVDARLPAGFPEGATVTLLGLQDGTWAHVRGSNGLEGWVPLQNLQQA